MKIVIIFFSLLYRTCKWNSLLNVNCMVGFLQRIVHWLHGDYKFLHTWRQKTWNLVHESWLLQWCFYGVLYGRKNNSSKKKAIITMFGTTWGWVNADGILIFEHTIALTSIFINSLLCKTIFTPIYSNIRMWVMQYISGWSYSQQAKRRTRCPAKQTLQKEAAQSRSVESYRRIQWWWAWSEERYENMKGQPFLYV